MMKIKTLSQSDLDFVFDVVDLLDWGYYPRDFERMMEFDQAGSFIALYKNQKAGFVMTSSYGQYAFIGPMVVTEMLRGRGLGESLLAHAIEYLENAGVKTIELDAVFKAASLYRRLGFKDKYFSYRMRKQVEGNGDLPNKLSEDMVDRLVEFDYEMTGIDRHRQILQFIREYPDSIYFSGRDRIDAWAMVRKRRGGPNLIGPLTASSTENAIDLFEKISTVYSGRKLALGVLEPAREFIRHLRDQRFIHNVPGLRMYYGPRFEYERNVFAIIGPEKG